MSANASAPINTLVWYYPKPGNENDLAHLLDRHWPTLRELGLVTTQAARVWRARDKRSGKAFFVEIFEWRDERASEIAHQTPQVMAVWESMGPLLESMQLAQLEPLNAPAA
jgi:quinol monooxygenase YgiN